MMLERFFGIFSGGSDRNSAGGKDNSHAIYVNRTTLSGGRKGYVVRGSETGRGMFYLLIDDAAKAVAKLYSARPNSHLDTVRESFNIAAMRQKELDAILLECEMSTGGKPAISSELRRQVNSYSEPRISIKKLQTAGMVNRF